MAQKDDSVLGTEEDTNNQENINEVSATLWWWVSEAFDFILVFSSSWDILSRAA